MIYKYNYIFNNKKLTVNLEAATFLIKKVKFDKNFSELVKIFFPQFLIKTLTYFEITRFFISKARLAYRLSYYQSY